MRLRKLLTLGLGITLGLIGLSLNELNHTTRQNDRLALAQVEVQRIARDSSGLLVLTQDYLLNTSTRASRQWHRLHQDISASLRSISATPNALTYTSRQLLEVNEGLPKLFEALESDKASGDAAFVAQRREMLADHLVTETRRISDGAFDLSEDLVELRRLNDQQHSQQTLWHNALLLVLVLAFVATVFVRVLRPIRRLQVTAQAVQTGDLTVRNGKGNADEMGALFGHFDAMTAALEERSQRLVSSNERLATSASEAQRARRDLQSILDAMPSMVGYWDKNLICRFANHAYLHWFGIDPARMPGMKIQQLMGGSLYERNKPFIEGALRGEPQTFERTIPAPDGSRVRHSLAHYLPDVVEGAVEGFYVLVHDVTEQVESKTRLTAALHENQALLNTIRLHAIMSIADRSGRIIDVNDRFCDISGYPREELLGQNHRIINSGQHGAEFWIDMWATISTGRPWRGVVCNRAKDGSLYWVDSIIAPLTEVDGSIERYISIRTDVTAAKMLEKSLKASEAFLNRTGRVAGVGGWQLDLQSQALDWSTQTRCIVEVDASYVPRLDQALKLYPPEARVKVENALNNAIAHGESFDFEVPFITQRGRTIQVRVAGEAVRDASGQTVQIAGAFQDVTERCQMEESIRRINALQHSILENLPCGLSAFDSELRLVACNSEFKRLLELEPLFTSKTPTFEEIIEYNAARGEYGDVDVARTMADAVDKARNPSVHRFERTRPNGTPIEIRGTPMPGGGFVTTYTDMSERKRAEQEVERNANLLRGAIDAVDEAFVLYDPEDRLVFCNEKYRALYEASRDLIVPGARFIDILRGGAERGQYAEAVGRIDAWLDERMANHARDSSMMVQTLNDGRVVRVIEQRMPDGHTVGFRIDITDLTRATEAAEVASRAKGEFLTNMSHEIRTPLSAIIGMTHLLVDTPLNDGQQHLLKNVQSASRSLLAIVNDVLDLSKIEAGEMGFETIEFSPHQLLEELEELFHTEATLKQLEFTVVPSPELPDALYGDVMRMRQLFTNLIGNALKFTQQGQVRVTLDVVSHSADSLRLRGAVHDTGIGIAAEAQQALFRPFTQADTSTSRRFGGTGLGLSIVRRIAELMGGQVGLDSELGVGSEFWFELPFQRHADSAIGAAKNTVALEVVVVSDGEASCTDVVVGMRALGWRTLVCDTEAALLELLADRFAAGAALPDALLLRTPVPGSGGPRPLAALAARVGDQQMPVAIWMVPYRPMGACEAAPMADNTVMEPLTPSALFNVVNDALARRSGNTDRVIAGTRFSHGQVLWLSGISVLVVDDSDINLDMAQRMLVREGALVQTASSGMAALDLLGTDPTAFDVVLMDVQMPEMDGLQTTRRLRDGLGLKQLPVLALTAGSMTEERQRALDAGMNEFLSKPLAPHLLIQSIRRGVERAQQRVCRVGHGQIGPTDLSTWPQIAGVNQAKSAYRMGYDQTLFLQMLRRLVRDFAPFESASLPPELSLLERETLADRMHKLRGSAGMLDAEEVHQAASNMETALRNGLDSRALLPVWTSLKTHMAELTLASADALQTASKQMQPDTTSHTPENGDAVIQQLNAFLKRQDLNALDYFKAQTSNLRGCLGGARFEELSRSLDELDFRTASKLLVNEETT